MKKLRCALVVLLTFAFVAELSAEAEKQWVTRDGRFVFRELKEGGFGVMEVKTEKTVLGADDKIQPVERSIAAVWAKDSRHLAVNYRSGGRYMATQLYAWTGEQFEQMTDVADVLSLRVDMERAAEVKRRKLPAGTYLRRIWDTFRTLRWLDGQTVEVFVYSERSYVTDKDTEETDGVAVTAVYTVRFDKRGEPKIVDRRKPTKDEAGD